MADFSEGVPTRTEIDVEAARMVGHYTAVVIDPKDSDVWSVSFETRVRIATEGAAMMLKVLRNADYIENGSSLDLIPIEDELRAQLRQRGEQ